MLAVVALAEATDIGFWSTVRSYTHILSLCPIVTSDSRFAVRRFLGQSNRCQCLKIAIISGNVLLFFHRETMTTKWRDGKFVFHVHNNVVVTFNSKVTNDFHNANWIEKSAFYALKCLQSHRNTVSVYIDIFCVTAFCVMII